MKRFIKFCAIIVAVVCIAGVGLMIVGAMGGGAKQLGGSIADKAVSFGEHIIRIEDGWIWQEDWNTYDLNEAEMFDDTFEIIRSRDAFETSFTGDTSIHSMELSLGGCIARITDSEDGDFHIRAEHIAALQTYVSPNGTLCIRGLKTGSFLQNDSSMSVTIEIPKEIFFDRLDISFGAGILEAENLRAADFEIDSGAGQVNIESLQTEKTACNMGAGQMEIGYFYADEADFDMGAGQIIIKDGVIVKELQIDMGAGDIRFCTAVPGNIEAECAVGNLILQIKDSTAADHNYELECVLGGLSVENVAQFKGTGGETTVSNGAASTYELTCSMGNLEVTFE